MQKNAKKSYVYHDTIYFLLQNITKYSMMSQQQYVIVIQIYWNSLIYYYNLFNLQHNLCLYIYSSVSRNETSFSCKGNRRLQTAQARLRRECGAKSPSSFCRAYFPPQPWSDCPIIFLRAEKQNPSRAKQPEIRKTKKTRLRYELTS